MVDCQPDCCRLTATQVSKSGVPALDPRAIYSGGAVKVVVADEDVEEVIALPGANPTNCAFDPSGRLGLVVTEAENGRLFSLPKLGPGAPLPG
jgi:hypothetical protein